MKILLFLLIFLISISSLLADEFETTRKNQRNFNSIQLIYQDGVPHTDKTGNILMEYDKEKSFFTIAAWGVPLHGEQYGEMYDWQLLKDAGFNTVWPYPIYPIDKQLEAFEKFDMQGIILHPINDEDLPKTIGNSHILGNCFKDEPIGLVGSYYEDNTPKSDKIFKEYTDYKTHAQEINPKLKIFVNDCTWNSEPATSWWVKWNTAGDIQCQDAYPITLDEEGATRTLAHNNIDLPNSVAWATAINKEQKPVWLIVGPFSQVDNYGGGSCFRWPTPNQLRSCVYAGIEHGATGIIYFIWDSFISREGRVIGMSPNPKIKMAEGDKYVVAKPQDLVNSKAMWETTKQINKELKELAPYILSKTIKEKTYSVKIEGKFISPNGLRCLLKPDGEGGYILFATNIDAAWLQAEFTFEKEFLIAETMFEDGKILGKADKVFKADFDPFETHIIHIR